MFQTESCHLIALIRLRDSGTEKDAYSKLSLLLFAPLSC